MTIKKWQRVIILILVLTAFCLVEAQEEAETSNPPVISSRDIVLNCTPNGTGERMEDGGPYVSDDIIERMKNVAITAAWSGVMRQ